MKRHSEERIDRVYMGSSDGERNGWEEPRDNRDIQNRSRKSIWRDSIVDQLAKYLELNLYGF